MEHDRYKRKQPIRNRNVRQRSHRQFRSWIELDLDFEWYLDIFSLSVFRSRKRDAR